MPVYKNNMESVIFMQYMEHKYQKLFKKQAKEVSKKHADSIKSFLDTILLNWGRSKAQQG